MQNNGGFYFNFLDFNERNLFLDLFVDRKA